jgi:hypothetical protein
MENQFANLFCYLQWMEWRREKTVRIRDGKALCNLLTGKKCLKTHQLNQ